MRRFALVALMVLAAMPAAARGLHGAFTATSPCWTRGVPARHHHPDPQCALDLTVRFMEWDSPYALYCLEVFDREPIEIWTDQAGTEYDPVLYLFCAPFDPADAVCRAVAFDDDGGPGSMAMFRASDDVRLEPGRSYWLMIAWFDSLREGRYLIDTSANVGLCAVPVTPAAWGAVKSLYR